VLKECGKGPAVCFRWARSTPGFSEQAFSEEQVMSFGAGQLSARRKNAQAAAASMQHTCSPCRGVCPVGLRALRDRGRIDPICQSTWTYSIFVHEKAASRWRDWRRQHGQSSRSHDDERTGRIQMRLPMMGRERKDRFGFVMIF
jgi:hypothetical protein